MENYYNSILNLEEYYSLEDFENNIMPLIDPNLTYHNNISQQTHVRVTFQYGKKTKEAIISKNFLKIRFIFIRIYYKELYMNILVFRNGFNINNPKDLLNRINSLLYFRGAISICLTIKEFPLKNYYLEENQVNNNTIDIDKIFILKNKNKPSSSTCQINNDTKNIFLDNSMNMNNYTLKMLEKSQLNVNISNKNEKEEKLEKALKEEINKNEKLNKKINQLEALLFEEKNKNSDLNKKIIKLEEIVNNKENELNQLRDEIIKNTSEVNDLYKKINKKNK